MGNLLCKNHNGGKEVTISIALMVNMAKVASIQQNVMLSFYMEDSVL